MSRQGESFASQICRAQSDDRESVLAMLRETEFFRAEELKIAQEVFDDAITHGPEGDYQSFVAKSADKTIGWICFGLTPCTVGTYDIYWVAVSPEYQNMGVGKSLVEYVTRSIKDLKGRMIAVDTSGSERYVSTRRFYETIGYRKEGCIKDFYSVGDDKVIYIRRI